MKTISNALQTILDRASDGIAPNRDELIFLLSFPESSWEAAWIRLTANQLSRKRFNNYATISAQIGFETFPCQGDCKFCAFGASHSLFPETKMSLEEIIFHAEALTKDGLLSVLWLMSMHSFEMKNFLKILAAVREIVPPWTMIASNIGDISLDEAKELKSAGLSSAYHTIRLREGLDTQLDPQQRLQTIYNIKEAGLHWGFCCEPIGPEHSNEELADQILLGLSLKPAFFSAMRRVWLPNSPLAKYGQITQQRLAQIVAIVFLSTVESPQIREIGCHEPHPLGLTSGANSMSAEYGANPRDNALVTTNNLGLTVQKCVQMLWETGFDGILRPDEQAVHFKDYLHFLSNNE